MDLLARLPPPVTSCIAAIVLAVRPVAADGPPDPPPGAVLLDGLAVLVGGSPAEEDEASIITLRQLDLQADLLLIRRHGAEWKRHRADGTLRLQARRVAVLVRLLARLARQTGEIVTPEDRDAAVRRLEERAGGGALFGELLDAHGTTRGEVAAWIEDALLARDQIRFLAERSDRWSGPGDDARRAARSGERAARIRAALDDWLPGVLERNLLGFLP